MPLTLLMNATKRPSAEIAGCSAALLKAGPTICPPLLVRLTRAVSPGAASAGRGSCTVAASPPQRAATSTIRAHTPRRFPTRLHISALPLSGSIGDPRAPDAPISPAEHDRSGG